MSDSSRGAFLRQWPIWLGTFLLIQCLGGNCGAGTPSPGKAKLGRDGQDYVWLPPGDFLMGCAGAAQPCPFTERPRHQVRLSEGFWIGRREVSVAAFKRYVAAADSAMPPEPLYNVGWTRLDLPVANVTWQEAALYCAWAGGRLPSEAEWEYAARGGRSGSTYYWGEEPEREFANYGTLRQEINQPRPGWSDAPIPVGSLAPNGHGLHDMLGNVEEWVMDPFDALYYRSSPAVAPPGPEPWSLVVARVVRGGSAVSKSAELFSASFRGAALPDDRSPHRGFRCVLPLP